MSLLLDALNKADQERKRSDGPPSIDSRHDAYRAHDGSKTPTLIIVLSIGTVLIVLLAAVYWLGMHRQQSTTATPIATIPQPPVFTPQPLPVTASTDAQVTAVEKDSDNKNISGNVSGEGDVANLYQQQTANNPAATISNAAPSVANNPLEKPLSTSPTSINQFANLPELNDLPTDVLEKIPTLKYTEHNYNPNGGNVVINGVVRHVNDQLVNGVVIDKILIDGMILHTESYSFKMRALNTWFNM
ncbi:MAG: general secretion pathway protein GspB [Pseudomonadota bacterium]